VAARLDQDLVEGLYRELERPLYNVVYRWLWDAQESRDVVQEAFVRLWRMRARVDEGTVRPLIYRIALNLAANRRRWRRLWRFATLDAAGERAAPGRATDEALAGAEQEARVRRAVDALPERLRRVIALGELAGMSYAEMSRVLGVPPGTVASRRNAAIAQLRQALAPTSQAPGQSLGHTLGKEQP
jgi:RNA polymerase sigma-70 factor (ECF subfamily)